MKNVGSLERVLRVLLGGALAAWAGWMFLGGGSLLAILLFIALAALGVDFVVTGARGYCPLYKWLGWSSAPRPESVAMDGAVLHTDGRDPTAGCPRPLEPLVAA